MSALKWKEKIITRTTAILNQKGGVGKTITTVNMAAILAADYHKSVLVIDADAQANTTEFFEGDAEHGKLGGLRGLPPLCQTVREGRREPWLNSTSPS